VLLKFHLLPLCLSLVRWWRFAEKSTVHAARRVFAEPSSTLRQQHHAATTPALMTQTTFPTDSVKNGCIAFVRCRQASR